MKASKAQLFLDEIVTNYINKKMPTKATRRTGSNLISPSHSPTRVKAPSPPSHLTPSATPKAAQNQEIFNLSSWLDKAHQPSRLLTYKNIERGALSGRKRTSKIISIQEHEPYLRPQYRTVNYWKTGSTLTPNRTAYDFKPRTRHQDLQLEMAAKTERLGRKGKGVFRINDSDLVLTARKKSIETLARTHRDFYKTIYQ